jgi:predicted methyltransferase
VPPAAACRFPPWVASKTDGGSSTTTKTSAAGRSSCGSLNRAIAAALKPGGAYVVVDASAREGRGVADARTLHRIEQRVVEEEVTKAGFIITEMSDVLRNPSDTRDWDSSQGPRVGTEDRFVLKFVRQKCEVWPVHLPALRAGDNS